MHHCGLETNACRVFGFIICSWKKIHGLLQRLFNNVLTIRLVNGFPILTTTVGICTLECWNSLFKNQPLMISDSISLAPSWSLDVIKQFGHLMWVTPEMDHLFLDYYFLSNNQATGVEGYLYISMEESFQRTLPGSFLDLMFLSFL